MAVRRKLLIPDLFSVESKRPLIVAELSGNHQQSYELAEKMVISAAKAGVDAIKLQTYTADTMTLALNENEFRIADADNLWKGRSLHDLYGEASTPWEWHAPLFDLAKSLGIFAFSSPFDKSAVDFLETLNVPCYKIASFELVDIPLIRYVASTGKPLIISTGMATMDEIGEAVSAAQNFGAKDIVLLKCTSTYPANISETNLKTMEDIRKKFRCPVGLSDHTLGIGASIASAALGCKLIERHFVLDRRAGGVDSAFSLEPHEMAVLVKESDAAFQALGSVVYGGSAGEESSKKYRRSIYFRRSMKCGEVVTANDIQVVRPGLGLHPRHFDELLGLTLNSDVSAGTPVQKQFFVLIDDDLSG